MLRAARVLSPKFCNSGGLSKGPASLEASRCLSTGKNPPPTDLDRLSKPKKMPCLHDSFACVPSGASRVVEVTSDDNYLKQIKSANGGSEIAAHVKEQ